MGCYKTNNRKPKEESNPSALMLGVKYVVDAMLLAVAVGTAATVIYYASCVPNKEPKVDHTPVIELDDIKQN